ncbi:MAG: hypothetical protein DRP70_14300 [Spirochaetes bacterium]|nr:MAG: hypothetical protein DRP70_14300 [Spirochaetota bacterium]
MSLINEVFASLENWGEHPVMREISSDQSEKSVNSEEFRYKVERLSRFLSRSGVGESVPVPMFLENSMDFPIVFLALINLKAIPVMVKMDYRTVELSEIFRNLKPDVVITEKSHLPVLAPWLAEKNVICRESGNFTELQSGPEQAQNIQVPDKIASINYTYRGYGYPLGSMAPHSQYLHGAKVLQDGLQAVNGESMLVILPMSHIFTLIGCIFVPLMNKLTAVISQSMNPRILFPIIQKYSVQHILSVPEVYELLYRVKNEEVTLNSLKAFVSGGSLLSPDKYWEYGRKFNVEVLHGYGLTEFTPVSRNIRGNSRPGTIGPLCEGIGYSFENGELLIETPHATRGYYRRDMETSEIIKGNLVRTGDITHMENSHLVFDQEKKKTRKINGNIIDLIEIENVIDSYPGTDRFRIEFEQGRLTSYLHFKTKDSSEKDKLRAYLIDRIARYKIPRIVTGVEI